VIVRPLNVASPAASVVAVALRARPPGSRANDHDQHSRLAHQFSPRRATDLGCVGNAELLVAGGPAAS
jgi:hypothetical protein